jgi:glycerol-3-phosphate cytidylyltransferase
MRLAAARQRPMLGSWCQVAREGAPWTVSLFSRSHSRNGVRDRRVDMTAASGASRRIGYAPGVYDLFHVGHLNILRNSRLACDYLIAGVGSDDRTWRAKGRGPVIPLAERLEIVASIRYVDEAVVEDLPTKLQMWERLRFDVIIKGDDWRGTDKGDRLERDFAPVGVEVFYLPYTVHTSSTILRQALNTEIGRRASQS